MQDGYIVVRIDGRGFHKFTKNYEFEKPNDCRALLLMNKAAHSVMEQIPDAVLAYGDSDEYSFLLRQATELFERREAKIVSTFVSTFTSFYTFHWSEFFSTVPLDLKKGLPTFDGRAVVYPNEKRVRQYFSWRQVDCHINNLYNTVFWTLVLKGGISPQEAENRLIGSLAKDKNEILFSEFGINYNNENAMFRKGSVIFREDLGIPKLDKELGDLSLEGELSERQKQRRDKKARKRKLVAEHIDIISDTFWNSRPWLLHGR